MSKQFAQQVENQTILPRFSTIDLEFVKEYLYIDFDEDDMLIRLLIHSAKEMILSHTDCTMEELDLSGTASVLMLMVISDLYNNRSTSATDVKIKFSPLFAEMKNTIRGTSNGYRL